MRSTSRGTRSTPSASLPQASVSSTYLSSSNGSWLQPRSHGPARTATARPRTGVSSLGVQYEQIVCALSESRGISPTLGLAFINLDTGEAVLSQIADSQTYVRTIHKLAVYCPAIILIVSTAATTNSKLLAIIEEAAEDMQSQIVLLDRKYWAEDAGLDYIRRLAVPADAEIVKAAVQSKYFAICCIAAVFKYIESTMSTTFPYHSIRFRYEASEGTMLIIVGTIHALELVRNLQDHKSKDSLFGLLNSTLTRMGARLLKNNMLQPLTDPEALELRYDALQELSTKEDTFFAVRGALKKMLDVEKVLTSFIVVPVHLTPTHIEQAVNNILALKHFITSVHPVYEALLGCTSSILVQIRELCHSDNTEQAQSLIDQVISEETVHANKPLDLRNQRIYAVKSGVNGLLDVARQTYKEAMLDAYQHIQALKDEHELALECCYDNTRQNYIRLPADELETRTLPPVFIHVFRRKKYVECQTLDLVKSNKKISDAHVEVLLMSDRTIRELTDAVRMHVAALSKICESIAMLDMLASFAHLVTSSEYVRPQITDTLAIKAARHPIRGKIQSTRFIPNDVYATTTSRFQIVTGCNMSGKSTYIRSVALLTIMAQIGCFVPATYASIRIIRQLFSRVSVDSSVQANMSTFSAEMQEMAHILGNIDEHSMAIVDELARGTSSRDGLAIALAIAEALTDGHALVYFATHFRELARILAEREGVVNLHLAVNATQEESIAMMYKLTQGIVEEEHYGLKLAKVLPFPADVLRHAENVARQLEERNWQKKQISNSIVHARRRKLVLGLEEQLRQASNGSMSDEVLKGWLQQLRSEFVTRMTAIDTDVDAARADLDDQSSSISDL